MSEKVNTNEKQLIQLAPNELQFYEQASLRWDCKIPAGVNLEDVMVPAFWSHHAMKLAPWHEIRVRAEDGTWMANLIVLDSSRTWARVAILSCHGFSSRDVSQSQASEVEVKSVLEAHSIVHRGPHKWSIVRKADKAIIQEGIEQKETAITELEKFARSQVGGAAARGAPVAA